MKPRPEKKPSLHHILPMELQVGDRLADETSEWEVIGRPYMSAGGKNAHVRVRWVDAPTVSEVWTWGAHERVSVRRATAEEGKQ